MRIAVLGCALAWPVAAQDAAPPAATTPPVVEAPSPATEPSPQVVPATPVMEGAGQSPSEPISGLVEDVRDDLVAEIKALEQERDALAEERGVLAEDNDQLRDANKQLVMVIDALGQVHAAFDDATTLGSGETDREGTTALVAALVQSGFRCLAVANDSLIIAAAGPDEPCPDGTALAGTTEIVLPSLADGQPLIVELRQDGQALARAAWRPAVMSGPAWLGPLVKNPVGIPFLIASAIAVLLMIGLVILGFVFGRGGGRAEGMGQYVAANLPKVGYVFLSRENAGAVKRELETLLGNADQWRAERDEARRALKDEQEQRQEMSRNLATHQEAVATERQWRILATQKSEEFKTRMTQMEAEISRARDELQARQSEAELMRREQDQLAQELGDLRAKHTRLSNDLEEAHARNTRLEVESEETRREAAKALENARSAWAEYLNGLPEFLAQSQALSDAFRAMREKAPVQQRRLELALRMLRGNIETEAHEAVLDSLEDVGDKLFAVLQACEPDPDRQVRTAMEWARSINEDLDTVRVFLPRRDEGFDPVAMVGDKPGRIVRSVLNWGVRDLRDSVLRRARVRVE